MYDKEKCLKRLGVKKKLSIIESYSTEIVFCPFQERIVDFIKLEKSTYRTLLKLEITIKIVNLIKKYIIFLCIALYDNCVKQGSANCSPRMVNLRYASTLFFCNPRKMECGPQKKICRP